LKKPKKGTQAKEGGRGDLKTRQYRFHFYTPIKEEENRQLFKPIYEAQGGYLRLPSTFPNSFVNQDAQHPKLSARSRSKSEKVTVTKKVF
jgi:hypothetical protein